jgi:hypothetical protein
MTCRLLYDGRWASDDWLLCGVCLGHDGQLMRLTHQVQDLPPLHKKFYRRPQFSSPTPLGQIVRAGTCENDDHCNENDPQTGRDLMAFLDRHCPPKTHVAVTYARGLQKSDPLVDWIKRNSAETRDETLCIVAYSDQDYTIRYAAEVEDRATRKALEWGKQVVKDYERYRQAWKRVAEKEKEEGQADALQSNCSSAVSASHSGLLLAHDLGLLTKQELSELSQRLGETQASLFVFLDERHHLRHVTYCDRAVTWNTQVPCFENDCEQLNESMSPSQQKLEQKYRSDASQVMLDFWHKVWVRRSSLIDARLALLKPLMDRLEALVPRRQMGSKRAKTYDGTQRKEDNDSRPRLRSPYANNLSQLKKAVHNQHLFVYSQEDACLHSLKFFLADFGYRQFKQFRGVLLKGQSDDALVRLSIPGLVVYNLFTYFNCQEDLHFFAGAIPEPWQGPPPNATVVKHGVKQLKMQHLPAAKHPDQIKGEILTSFCGRRGLVLARHILASWVRFGQFLLHAFGYEIHSEVTPPAASYLAFQCIWARYIRAAGPLSQSMEKTKPFYEDLLRDNSRGGFMHSAQSAVYRGQPLHGQHNDDDDHDDEQYAHCTSGFQDLTAETMAEFDINSAYGYASSRVLVPGGFCTGFGFPDEKGIRLRRLDKRARHCSFEFRAVFKYVDHLVRVESVPLQSWYHNYSNRGLFTIGKYNLDLALVTKDGRLILVNFDSNFVHSCDTCSVSEKRFVGGQTHEQVREKSRRRDADILNWVQQFNDAPVEDLAGWKWTASYTVFSDCHSPGYTTTELKQDFEREPSLRALVEGYDVTDRFRGDTLDLRQFEDGVRGNHADRSYTFIAKARVSIDPSPEQDQSLGPLIVYSQPPPVPMTTTDEDDGAFFTTDRRSRKPITQSLAWSGTVVLTRDYYDWLCRHFGSRFQLHGLEFVLFYKAEPAFNTVYRQLVDLRSRTSSPILVTFIKRMVNLSCGFYGSRASLLNSRTTYRIVNRMPKNYAFFRHAADWRYTIDLSDTAYFLLETKPWPRLVNRDWAGGRGPAKNAIAFFVCIVEFGKLRMIEIFHFLRTHLKAKRYRLFYSNIDNCIVALSTPSILEAVRPDRVDSFRALLPSFMSLDRASKKEPGRADCQWLVTDCDWKFITLRTQHYVLAAPEQDKHKTSGLSRLGSQEAFRMAEELLRGRSVKITQERRAKKLLGLETRPVEFHLRPLQ